MLGIIKWFDNEMGYGFIQYKNCDDIFIHYSNILKDGYKKLEKGQIVSFNIVETAKGLQALNISVIKED